MGYRIKTVADMTGVSKGTLLAWERRYGFVIPERQDNGYREFTDEDVARIRKIRALIDSGYKVSEAISLAQQVAVVARTDLAAPPPSDDEGALDQLRRRYLDALLHYDPLEMMCSQSHLSALPYQVRIDAVLLPTLRSIGEGWERGEVSITQEHHASERIREELMGMLAALGHGPAKGVPVVCAAFPGELHVLGLLALAVMEALNGRRVYFLGADVPLADLVAMTQQVVPREVLVCAVMPVPRPALLQYAEALRRDCPSGTLLTLGGAGLPDPLPVVEGVCFLRHLHEVL